MPGALAVLALGVLTLPSLRGGWYANLGALAQARSDLADWPTGSWVDPFGTSPPPEALAWYARAADAHAAGRTVNHRLGLVAIEAGDYPAASELLARAQQRAPDHQGIRKARGYAALWSGDLPAAQALLAPYAGVARDLSEYAFWLDVRRETSRAVQTAALAELLQGDSP